MGRGCDLTQQVGARWVQEAAPVRWGWAVYRGDEPVSTHTEDNGGRAPCGGDRAINRGRGKPSDPEPWDWTWG